MFETVICRDVLEDIVDLSAVDYTKRHTTPSPEVVLVSYILLLESPCPSLRPSVRPSVTEKDRIVLANEYTMPTSSPMYDAVKMMMIIIIYVRCDHHHDDYHHHLCTMRSSSR